MRFPLKEAAALLERKASFVQDKITEERRPSPPQTAAFLRELVSSLAPAMEAAGPRVQAELKAGLADIGWDVATNAPAPGAGAPPAAELLVSFCVCGARSCRFGGHGWATATPAEAATALGAVRDEVKAARQELEFLEEDGGLTAKQAKQADKLAGRIEQLELQEADAGALLAASEAAAPEEAGRIKAEKAKSEQASAAAAVVRRQAAGAKAELAQQRQGKGAAGGGGGGGGGGKGRANAAAGEEEEEEAEAEAGTDIVAISSLRKGSLILVDGRTLKVQEISTSKTGKHGHAKSKLVCIDEQSGKRVEVLRARSDNIDAPRK